MDEWMGGRVDLDVRANDVADAGARSTRVVLPRKRVTCNSARPCSRPAIASMGEQRFLAGGGKSGAAVQVRLRQLRIGHTWRAVMIRALEGARGRAGGGAAAAAIAVNIATIRCCRLALSNVRSTRFGLIFGLSFPSLVCKIPRWNFARASYRRRIAARIANEFWRFFF